MSTTKTKKTATAKSAKAKPAAKAEPKAPRKTKAEADGKLSALDAAHQVLAKAKEPLNTKEMIEKMAAAGLWSSPGGKTPHATLYTVVTMLPKTWRPGIDYSPETGCDRSMDLGGGRGKPLMVKGLRSIVPIAGGCHGRHEKQTGAATHASSFAGVCGWSVGEAVVEPGV